MLLDTVRDRSRKTFGLTQYSCSLVLTFLFYSSNKVYFYSSPWNCGQHAGNGFPRNPDCYDPICETGILLSFLILHKGALWEVCSVFPSSRPENSSQPTSNIFMVLSYPVGIKMTLLSALSKYARMLCADFISVWYFPYWSKGPFCVRSWLPFILGGKEIDKYIMMTLSQAGLFNNMQYSTDM